MDDAGAKVVQAMRVDTRSSTASTPSEDEIVESNFLAPAPVDVFFMDLPLLIGDEVPHAPYIAALADPWPGGGAIYSSPTDNGFSLLDQVNTAASAGMLLSDLEKQCTGQFLPAATIDVEMANGTLNSTTQAALLSGANTAAIGTADDGDWEVVQFENAQLIDVNTYRLTGIIRGQAGSDGVVPAIWPAGARFVLLSTATEQLDLPASSVGVARTYRFGPANKGYSDPSYTEITLGFDGAVLRPYPPCHLAVEADSVGGLQLKWIRRTRISGDSWSGLDVPIGEESEMYEIAAQQGGIVKYRGMTTQPNWTATAALLATDFDSTPITFSVAQISAIYGVGPATQITTL